MSFGSIESLSAASLESANFSGATTPDFTTPSNQQLDAVRPSGIPKGLIHLDPELPQLVWVDLERGSMHLIKQSRPGWFEESQEIPISIGKLGYDKFLEGDLRTPVGIYQVTSYLNDNQVASKYGNGAFPLNYPNIYDRLRKRTGSGIWLHGLPKGVLSRPKLDSDGCVVIDNLTFDAITPLIKTEETLVVLGTQLVWQQSPPLENQTMMSAFDLWLKDWQEIDTQEYLSHYDATFTDTKRDIDAWKRHKTRINKSKQWIKVGVEKLSVLMHPQDPNLATVRFYQTYQSNNYQWRGWKHLLWRKNIDNQWRIIYEGNG